MRMAFGSMAFVPGEVGTLLKMRPKPSPSHSEVTPIQLPALFLYSTRIHGPPVTALFIWATVPGPTPFGEVSSPISGNPVAVQLRTPLSVKGLTQPFTPGVAQPKYSVLPAVRAYAVAAAVGNS